MTILGVETATNVCAAAVVNNGHVKAEQVLDAPQIHSEKLVGMIQEVLSEAGVAVERLDAVAVSAGPGSFTGLRIGMSVAKGLAYSRDLQLVAVGSLEALAWRDGGESPADPKQLILTLIDARRDEVYMAAYRRGDKRLHQVVSPRVAALGEICGHLVDAENVLVMGSGAVKFRNHHDVTPGGKQTFIYLPPSRAASRASAVALCGEQMLARGEIADLSSIEPLYIKEFFTKSIPQHDEA